MDQGAGGSERSVPGKILIMIQVFLIEYPTYVSYDIISPFRGAGDDKWAVSCLLISSQRIIELVIFRAWFRNRKAGYCLETEKGVRFISSKVDFCI